MDALIAVGMFTVIVLALVVVVLAARSKLVNSEEVSILINDEKTIKVPAGTTLLNALSAEKLFIPSACGGKGSCGVCKVDVHLGGGSMLPTEEGHITKKEARHGCRLACQLKIKGDMEIELEPEVFSVKKWECTVTSNENVATFIKEFKLSLPDGESVPFRAGGYIQIECPPHRIEYKNFEIEEQYNVGKVRGISITWFLTRKEALFWESQFHKKFRLKHSPARGGKEWFTLTVEEISQFVDWMRESNRQNLEKINILKNLLNEKN